ncbi:MAG: four helix bundle protein [Gemmatimonas sp.]
MRDVHKLLVYGKALALAVRVNEFTRGLSARRYRNLADQLSAAAESIPANIQEGCAESSRREFARFLQIAVASSGETANHLLFANRCGAMDEASFNTLNGANTEVRRMLASLLKKVRDELNEDDADPSIQAMQRRRVMQRSKENGGSRKPRKPPG